MKEILILSGKGGTGKTTVASALIRLSQVKAYGDCDVDAPNLHLLLGEEDLPAKKDYYGLAKASINPDLCTSCDLCRIHCRFKAIYVEETYIVDPIACEGCGVCQFVCPERAIEMVTNKDGDLILYKNKDRIFSTAQLKMGSGTSGLLVREVKKQMKDQARDASLAIIDGSPGLGCPVIASISGVDLVVIVAEPSISGISDMERIVKTTRKLGGAMAICINKYDTNMERTLEIRDYCSKEKITFLGQIPFDNQAVEAINMGKTIVDIDCKSGEAVREIYKNIMELMEVTYDN